MAPGIQPMNKSHNLRHNSIVRMILLLAAVGTLCLACQTTASFQEQFDKNFVYSPIMQVAINPGEIVPTFDWVDMACETMIYSGGTGGVRGGTPTGGGGGGGLPPCPT